MGVIHLEGGDKERYREGDGDDSWRSGALVTITTDFPSRPAMPQSPPTNIPSPVLGTMSPYPTVVIVTSAHQMESGMLIKSFVGLSRILKKYEIGDERCQIFDCVERSISSLSA